MYVIMALACFPLFVVFLMKPQWGVVAFGGYVALGWTMGVYRPLQSGLDKIITVCTIAVVLSYVFYRLERSRHLAKKTPAA